MTLKKQQSANTVHIAVRGSVVHQLRIHASQFRVLRTGTLFPAHWDIANRLKRL
jgi:hypothetical protein